MTDDLFNDRFHWCVLAAGFQAYCEGRLGDSAYVKELASRSYDNGEFQDRVKPRDRAVKPSLPSLGGNTSTGATPSLRSRPGSSPNNVLGCTFDK